MGNVSGTPAKTPKMETLERWQGLIERSCGEIEPVDVSEDGLQIIFRVNGSMGLMIVADALRAMAEPTPTYVSGGALRPLPMKKLTLYGPIVPDDDDDRDADAVRRGVARTAPPPKHEFTDAAFRAFGAAVTTPGCGIVECDIRGFRLDGMLGAALAQGASAGLTHPKCELAALRMWSCGIRDATAQIIVGIFSAVQVSWIFKELSMGDNPITPEMRESLGQLQLSFQVRVF